MLTIDNTIDGTLALVDGSHDELTLGRVPQTVVDDLSQSLRVLVTETTDFTVEGQTFQVDVGVAENGTAGGFVTS